MELYEAPRHRRAMRARRVGYIRPLLVLWLAVAFLWLALASLGPAPANAQVYDPALAARRAEFVRTIVKVRVCSFDATKAVFAQGVTDRKTVTTFTAASCGRPLALMMQRDGHTGQDTLDVVTAIADKAYDDAISWGRK